MVMIRDMDIFQLLRGRRRGRTGRKRLLQLLGLVVVLEHESVQVAVASDLELGLVRDARLLYPRGWRMVSV